MSNSKTLEEHRAIVEKETLQLIDEVLNDLRKKKQSYEYPSHLAEYVASQISRKRGKPLSYTTLNRNKVYKKRLLLFMGTSQKIKELKLNERKELEDENYDMKFKLGSALEENRRLKKYIEGMLQTEEDIRALPDSSSGEQWKERFKQLIILTNALKEHLVDELTWDIEKHVVIDDAYEREIIRGEPVKAFDEYVARVSELHGNFNG